MDSLLSSPERNEMAKLTLEELKKRYHGKVDQVDLAAELWAAQCRTRELKQQLAEMSDLKEQDRRHIEQLTTRIGKIKELSLDQITLMGQVDVAIWGAREVGLERYLNPEFKRILQNQGSHEQRFIYLDFKFNS